MLSNIIINRTSWYIATNFSSKITKQNIFVQYIRKSKKTKWNEFEIYFVFTVFHDLHSISLRKLYKNVEKWRKGRKSSYSIVSSAFKAHIFLSSRHYKRKQIKIEWIDSHLFFISLKNQVRLVTPAQRENAVNPPIFLAIVQKRRKVIRVIAEKWVVLDQKVRN